MPKLFSRKLRRGLPFLYIADAWDFQPVGPGAVGEYGFDYAVAGPHGLDDLAVPDVDSDMARVPDGEAGNLRDGLDRALL